MNATATLPLFPELPQAGRPAPGAEPLRRRAGVEYFDLLSREILNRADSDRLPFDWTINPYRGCEFGCVYCYARATHAFFDLDRPEDFETRIFVKRLRRRPAAPRAAQARPARPDDRHRHRDRSLSAGREALRDHPLAARGLRRHRGAGARADHQVAARAARPRPLRPARRAPRGRDPRHRDHPRRAAGPAARAAGARSGGPPSARRAAGRSRPRGAGQLHAAPAGPERRRGEPRRPLRNGAAGRRDRRRDAAPLLQGLDARLLPRLAADGAPGARCRSTAGSTHAATTSRRTPRIASSRPSAASASSTASRRRGVSRP